MFLFTGDRKYIKFLVQICENSKIHCNKDLTEQGFEFLILYGRSAIPILPQKFVTAMESEKGLLLHAGSFTYSLLSEFAVLSPIVFDFLKQCAKNLGIFVHVLDKFKSGEPGLLNTNVI